MKKSNGSRSKFTPIFIAFLALAVVFLALGMGTLGSFESAGADFELSAPVTSDNGVVQNDYVVFRLSYTATRTVIGEDGKEEEESIDLKLSQIYIYTTAIYTEPGTSAGLQLERGTSSTSYSYTYKAELANIGTAEADDAEAQADKPAPVPALWRWSAPFDLPAGGWSSLYRYIRLTATTADLRLGEVVFVGVNNEDSADTARYIIPATVYSATPHTAETSGEAQARAGALLDAQPLSEPVVPQSSYSRFTDEEISSMLTVNEMRQGNTYSVNASSVDTKIYNGDRVYNAFGTDILALGTLIFGMNPFGLRFFPMLASFGVLIVGYLLAKQLSKRETAGLVFAVLYVLCDLSFSLGHLGTPLMIGVFFFLLSVLLCYRFYKSGMKKANIASSMPLFAAGLSAAAAVCVNGVYLIPVAGVAALFALGMVRQQKAKRYYLDLAIEEAEQHKTEDGEIPAGQKEKIAAVTDEYRYKNFAASVWFVMALVLGGIVLSLLALLPAYPAYLKLYGSTSAAPSLFTLGGLAFAGGFTGIPLSGGQSAWNFFYLLFRGTGDYYAVTLAAVNVVAVACGLYGLVYGVLRIVSAVKGGDAKKLRGELRRTLVPAVGLLLSVVVSLFGGGAMGFVFLAYLFSFLLAAQTLSESFEEEGKWGKIVFIVAVALLAVYFALLVPFTFSVPLPAGLIGTFF